MRRQGIRKFARYYRPPVSSKEVKKISITKCNQPRTRQSQMYRKLIREKLNSTTNKKMTIRNVE